MAASVGKRYVSPSGAEVIVTRGGPGDLSDGEAELVPKEQTAFAGSEDSRTEPIIQLGKRYASSDGEVELLVVKSGVCDLRYNGEPMTVLAPKVLPSAD
jgi:hypothetical protein